mgnify:FL=1|jgi:hypothetical protein|tara:strand:+ start:1003 stop:1206 length:204 start_codon:yes stop_codon:yes gene_type:complete
MDFVLNIISVVTGIVCAASIICSLTPTPKDDELIGRFYKLIEIAALNIGKAKEGNTTNPIKFVKRSD